MIKLKPPAPEPGDKNWQRWRKDCDEAKQALIEYHEQGKGELVEVERKLYRRESIIKRYYCNGDAPFHGKCVYCEAKRAILHVEHYRPKNAVTGARDRELPDGTEQSHPGYYWLAYELDNLLLSCEDCNVKFKGTQFPLKDEGTRAWLSSDDLTKEAPLLLCPFEEDEPSQHLSLDLETGILSHKTNRGEQTIKRLGLNLRGLPEERRKVVTEIEHCWSQWFAVDSNKQQRDRAFEKIKNHKLGRCTFTLTARLTLAHLRAQFESLATELGT
ncbi:MAG: hypothetical protein AAGF11_23015 [Myxococcota bacterium]